jgi:hypothetical protein
VAAEQKRLRREEDKRFNATVNDALRQGLRPSKPFRMRSVSLGKPMLTNVDNITEALASEEREDFK